MSDLRKISGIEHSVDETEHEIDVEMEGIKVTVTASEDEFADEDSDRSIIESEIESDNERVEDLINLNHLDTSIGSEYNSRKEEPRTMSNQR